MPSNLTTSNVLGLQGSPIPPEGLKSFGPLICDWSVLTYQFDFNAQQQLVNLISACRSLWIDHNIAAALTINFYGPNGSIAQRIIWPAKTQGYLTVIAPNPIKFSASCAAGSGQTFITGFNTEQHAQQWAVV